MCGLWLKTSPSLVCLTKVPSRAFHLAQVVATQGGSRVNQGEVRGDEGLFLVGDVSRVGRASGVRLAVP